MIEELVHDQIIQSAIEKLTQESGEDVADIEKRIRRYAYEIVPAFKAVFYFSIGYWLAKILLLTLYRAKMVLSAGSQYEQVGRDATVVLFMNHRSNMDVLLVNYLLSNQSTVSHAAGEWARLWPLHHLVRLAGNYVVDREADDPLYRLVLKRYVQMAVSQGIHLGIFPEGGLTRDGNIQPLQFGLLNYVCTADWPGHDRDVIFIPTAFNYDRVPEQQGLVHGAKKEYRQRSQLHLAGSSLMFCLKLFAMMCTPWKKRFGWACASFGEPISFKNWQRSRGIDIKSLPKQQQRQHINELGEQLMQDVRAIIPVLPIHLLALALLENETAEWTEAALVKRAEQLRLAVESANAPIFAYNTDHADAYQQALQMLEKSDALTFDEQRSINFTAEQADMLRYYCNSVSHYLLPQYSKLHSTSHRQFDTDSSIGFDPSDKNQLSIFLQSQQRVQEKVIDGRSFIAHFYDKFIATSPSIAAKFKDTDMQRQQEHLQLSLEHMVDFFVAGKPSERLRRTAESHGTTGRDIASEMYDVWLSRLLDTVKIYDDEYDPRTGLCWRSVMLPGIDYMRGQHDMQSQSNSQKQLLKQTHTDPTASLSNDHNGEQAQGIVRWIQHWSQRDPNKLALRSKQRSLSYAELENEIEHLAAGLSHLLGVAAGDRVAYLAPNRVEFIVLLFACAKLGAILTPINLRLSPTEQEKLIRRADVKAILIEPAELRALSKSIEDIQCVSLDGENEPNSALHYRDLLIDKPPPVSSGSMNSPLLLVFTSGSTGEPKGAVLTQSAVHWNAQNSQVMHDLKRSDHIATSLPFFHVGGINIQTLPALHVGATVSIFSEFDATEFAQFVESQKPTLTVLVPVQMQQMMALANWNKLDMSSLRAVSTGSTLVNKDLIRLWANKGIPVIQIYGCTESGPIAVHQTVEGIGPGLGSVGHSALHTEVKIVNFEGETLTSGSEGEILLRGPHIMSHYWQDEPATEQALHNGWLSTGDLGYLDKDQRLVIVGRKKRLIISGGENIHPAEIEQILEQHPAISEAAVVGIADVKWGEVPVAILSLTDPEFSQQDVRSYLEQHLGRYKHPRHILFVDTIPHTALGKIAYPEVSELAEVLGAT